MQPHSCGEDIARNTVGQTGSSLITFRLGLSLSLQALLAPEFLTRPFGIVFRMIDPMDSVVHWLTGQGPSPTIRLPQC